MNFYWTVIARRLCGCIGYDFLRCLTERPLSSLFLCSNKIAISERILGIHKVNVYGMSICQTCMHNCTCKCIIDHALLNVSNMYGAAVNLPGKSFWFGRPLLRCISLEYRNYWTRLIQLKHVELKSLCLHRMSQLGRSRNIIKHNSTWGWWKP